MQDIMENEGNFSIYYDLEKGRFPTVDETYNQSVLFLIK
jgi:hypothetical protein